MKTMVAFFKDVKARDQAVSEAGKENAVHVLLVGQAQPIGLSPEITDSVPFVLSRDLKMGGSYFFMSHGARRCFSI